LLQNQTNLLALNAAIESRQAAGEHHRKAQGRASFAVVDRDEVSPYLRQSRTQKIDARN